MKVKVTDSKLVGVVDTPNRRENFGIFDADEALPRSDFFAHLRTLPDHDRLTLLRNAIALRVRAQNEPGVLSLLTSFDFLATRLIGEHEERTETMDELLSDFDEVVKWMGSRAGDLARIHDALELGRTVLEANPGQLAEQLFGRLTGHSSPEILRLLEGALRSRAEPWLRPLTSSLNEPTGALRRVFLVPPGRPEQLAVHPDGDRCVAALYGGLVIWNFERTYEQVPERGAITLIPIEDLTDVTDLLVTRDGSLAIAAQRGGEIRGWSLSRLQEEFTAQGQRAVLTILEMPGGILLSAGTDGAIQAWRLPGGTWLRTVCEPGDSIEALIALPDGQSFVSAGDLVRIWDLASGAELHAFDRTDWPEVQAAAISSDGRKLLGAVNNDFAVWDLTRREKLFQVAGRDTRRIHSVAADPRRNLALIGNGNGELVVHSLDDGSEVYRFQAHQGALADLDLTPDGRLLLTASWDQTVKLWDLTDLPPADREAGHRHGGGVHALTFVPGRPWALSGGDDGAVILWSLETYAPLRTLVGHTKWVRALASSTDGARAVSASWDGTVKIWELGSGEAVLTLKAPEMPDEEHFESLAWSADARKIAVGTYSGMLILWDLEHSDSPRIIPGAHRSSITSLAFSDTPQLISISEDGSLKLWDQQGNQLRVLEDETPPPEPIWITDETTWSPGRPKLTGLAFLPETSRILTTSSAGVLALWDLEAGAQITNWPVTSFGITGLAVSADGRLAAVSSGTPTSSGESSLRIWDLAEEQLVAHFIGETPMMGCTLSADGRLALAGDKAGRIHFLYLELPDGSSSAGDSRTGG